MPYIKDSFSILAECAAIDLPDTRRIVRESEVRSDYENIEEASEYAFTAEMVPVVELDGQYYTEAQCMAPFMRDAGIRSMVEALDIIAEANNLPAKSVGLLIESEAKVSEMIEKACQSESGKAKDAVMNKIGKVNELTKDLKSKGYPIKRKKSKVNEASEDERARREKEKAEKKAKHDEERARKEKEYEEKKAAREKLQQHEQNLFDF